MVMRMPTTTVHRPLTMPVAQLMTLIVESLISQPPVGVQQTGGPTDALPNRPSPIHRHLGRRGQCLTQGLFPCSPLSALDVLKTSSWKGWRQRLPIDRRDPQSSIDTSGFHL